MLIFKHSFRLLSGNVLKQILKFKKKKNHFINKEIKNNEQH